MLVRSARLLSVVALAAGMVVALAPSATAVGSSTFTRITTPTGTTIYPFNGAPSATNNLTVSGQASADLNGSSVDIDCIFNSTSGINVKVFATAVPVTSGSFSVVASMPTFPTNCRLRAIPSGVDPTTDYLGSYPGPILYANTIAPNKDGSTTYGYTAAGEQGSGVGLVASAGECGAAILATVATPTMDVRGPGRQQCEFALPSGNITTTGLPTQSSIRVSGHNAYLPSAVHSYLRGNLSLTVSQSALATSFTRATNGDIAVTESATLMRCSVADTYPPTLASCPQLISAGVKFTRVVNIFRGAHQIRFRDTFASTDGLAHAVSVQYLGSAWQPSTGATGYTFPGHSSSYSTATPDEVVTGLGTKAATMLVRSDIYGFEGDGGVDTIGLTWSRAPLKIQFAHGSSASFAMPYSMTVPASGKAYLGFAESEAPLTSDCKARAAVAVNETVSIPTISSPLSGASIHGTTTTVKGVVALGANGLVKTVSVNGHLAHLVVNSAKTATSYSVTFTEALGKHTIKVTAADAAGNTSSRSILVKNI